MSEMKLDQKSIAGVLEEIAIMQELKGENPFKSRAYRNAARTLETTKENIAEYVSSGTLNKLPGIGKGIAENISILANTGELPYYNELKSSLPEGLFDVMRIPGLGPKKVKALWDKLDITNIGELEYACMENRLIELQGFGDKTQKKILQGIEYVKKYVGNFHYPVAKNSADELLEYMKICKDVIEISIAGSLRRHKETVKDIDILVSTNNPENVMNHFVEYESVEEVINHGSTKSSIRLESGINTDLRAIKPEEYPYALHHFTGSKEHNTLMRSRSKSMGLKMNEYGLFKGDKNIKCSNEEELFKQLGLDYIPPELREGSDEIEAAESGSLPNLVTSEDIKGIIHIHTTWSDGRHSVEDVSKICEKLGYEYAAIADHSRSLTIANGLKIESIEPRRKEVDKVNKENKNVKVLCGIEADILPNGDLDYPDEILAEFDLVIAAVHSHWNMPEKEMTERVCKAFSNPHVHMLAHPTGRLLLSRESYPINLDRIINIALEQNKIIELNANPYRLDLDWRWCRKAKEKGVQISINPDAHKEKGWGDVHYGVGIARKGWLEAQDIVNTLSYKDFVARLKKCE